MDEFIKNHPAFLGMDMEKLEFIKNFAAKEKPQNMKDVMPFLLANMNIAKKQQIHFSKSEVHLICDLLCKDLPEEEQNKVKRIINLLG